MPINAGYEYFNAEKVYLEAQTLEEKITALEAMIKVAPKHKSSENFLAELKTRLKKFKEKQEKNKKTGKTSRKAIKKEGFQCAILGFPSTGKSSLLAKLTNARPVIASYAFTTKHAEVGTMDYEGVKAQIIDLPAIGSEYFDQGIINTADCLLILIESLEDLEKMSKITSKATGEKIFLFNKSDLLSNEQQRKLEALIRSKKIPAIIISTITNHNLDLLKRKIFEKMHVIRIYTKEPGKPRTYDPLVLPESSTVKVVAESILKGLSLRIKETRLTGPSSKFPNQRVGLMHICKDKDIVEFRTK